MIRNHFRLRHAMALTVSVAALSCNVHDNTVNIPNATVNVSVNASVDVDHVQAGQDIPVNVMVQNVYLVAPTDTVPAEHMDDAGHIQVYLDDVSTTPLIITAETTFNVPIPVATKAGKHNLICRVHKHDNTPTTTKKTIEITVTVSVDANVSDAGATGGATGTGGAGGGATGGAGGSAVGGTSGIGGAGGM